MTLPPRPRIELDDDADGPAAPAGDVKPTQAPAEPPARAMMPAPRIELETVPATRLQAEPPAEVLADPTPTRRAPLVLAGAVTLAAGVGGLSLLNFVADQFARATWLGWTTLAVSGVGAGLVGAGVWREIRVLRALRHVDGLRADLASHEPQRIMSAAMDWAATVPGGPALLPALRAVNDPDAALALLRAGPGQALRAEADRLGRSAAVQMVAGIAAMPSPALDVAMVAWRGVRLVRQVAQLYGVRPGMLGTLALLRRTAGAATMVGAAEFAGNAAAHAVLSHPLLAHLAGEMAGAGVAARRMVVLARAAAAACDPLQAPVSPRRSG
jgi:putative membrane protein